MSFILVSENIKAIEDNIRKLNEQLVAIQTELIRAEGGLRIFKQLKDLGVEQVPTNQPDEVTNTEVISSGD
jgi:uncharacterized protein involved in exopolysaccharide biosynthesis